MVREKAAEKAARVILVLNPGSAVRLSWLYRSNVLHSNCSALLMTSQKLTFPTTYPLTGIYLEGTSRGTLA